MEDVDLVCVISNYNRGDYIGDCIDSIASQITQYSFTVVIIDDCSTDNSLAVVDECAKKFDDIQFSILKTSSNTGSGKKAIIQLSNELNKYFNAKFFMRIDSDDYLLDCHKFEKQIDALRQNPGCVACCHRYLMVDGRGLIESPPTVLPVGQFSGADLLRMRFSVLTYAHTSTFIYRNVHGTLLPPEFYKHSTWFGDLLFNWCYLKHGDVYYLEDCMSAYRIHKNGVWSGAGIIEKKIINLKTNFRVFYVFKPSLKWVFLVSWFNQKILGKFHK